MLKNLKNFDGKFFENSLIEVLNSLYEALEKDLPDLPVFEDWGDIGEGSIYKIEKDKDFDYYTITWVGRVNDPGDGCDIFVGMWETTTYQLEDAHPLDGWTKWEGIAIFEKEDGYVLKYV